MINADSPALPAALTHEPPGQPFGRNFRQSILRPANLEPLFVDVTTISGVGPTTKVHLGRLLGKNNPRLIDLLCHLPFRRIELIPVNDAALLEPDMLVTLEGTVGNLHAGGSRRHPSRIEFHALGQEIDLIFFGVPAAQLEKRLPADHQRILHGRLTRFRNRWQIAHPDIIDAADARPHRALPVYSAIAPLPQWRLRKLAAEACRKIPDLDEWLEPASLENNRWIGWRESMRRLHQAECDPEDPLSPARCRLAFDELLANQLALAIARPSTSEGRSLQAKGALRQRLLAQLPFALTAAQDHAIETILEDLKRPLAMRRLLQGDVGSGKTMVALMAMLYALESGVQSALMAPTEVLAEQHAATIGALLRDLGIDVLLLTGKVKGRARQSALAAIEAGDIMIVIGTHAIFEEAIKFFDLGFVVIDEQHRFGVNQRLKLTRKGKTVDHLLMTATPIPRSLILSHYGDIATSKLDEKPAGRQPIRTRVMPLDRIEELLCALDQALARSERIFWICPLVEISDKIDLKAAEARYEELQSRYGDAVGLIHGQMSADAKMASMTAFVQGTTRLLVATTVVEVGVDVPEATIVIIEHAERFGLAQLHQLRGRVGRGSRPGSCILLYSPPLSVSAKARLRIMRQTEDGFRIAAEDLRLRGPGEILGTQQSGLPPFRFADLSAHEGLIEQARETASRMLADPATYGERVNLLLHLFERQEAIDRLSAG